MHLWHSRVREGLKGRERAWRVSALSLPFRSPLAQGARTNPCGNCTNKKRVSHAHPFYLQLAGNGIEYRVVKLNGVLLCPLGI